MKHSRFLQFVSMPTALLTLVAFTGCQQTPSASQTEPATATTVAVEADTTSTKALQKAADTSWSLAQWTSADGTTHLPGLITLRLGEGGRVTGSSGENAYFGTAAVTADGSLNWASALAATRVQGSPETVKRESAYVADLKATTQVELKRNRLIFTGAGPLSLEFIPASE